MIPITLTIQGLYSYQTRQTIDFTRLTSAGIFGIFGAVGSGKSTIIEAITYALFGRTDRLNLSGDNRNYNMMNLKSNELLIEFVFRTGHPENTFMAVVRGKRNSRQFGEVKSLDRSVYQKNEGEWTPISSESLEKFIGLSYENFKRTVIIPQGKFQEFLLLGNKERTQMMKELFNLEKFELYNKVASLENKTIGEKQLLAGNLQQIGDVSPELVESTIQEIQQAETLVKKQTLELATCQKEEAGLRILRELTAKISSLELELAGLRLKEPDILQLEQKINNYTHCRMHFQALLESKSIAGKNISDITRDIEADQKLLTETSLKLEQLNKEMEELSKAYAEKESLKTEADDLEKIAHILILNTQMETVQLRIPNGEKHLAENQRILEEIKTEAENFTITLKQLKTSLPDLKILSELKQWFTVQKMNGKLLQDIQMEEQSARDAMKSLEDKVSSLIIDIVAVTGDDRMDASGIFAIMDQKLHLEAGIKEQLNQELNHYQVQVRLMDFANGLVDGSPCPLCGSVDHPHRLDLNDVSGNMSQVQLKIRKQEEHIRELEGLHKVLMGHFTSYQHHVDSLAKIMVKKDEMLQRIQGHQQSCPVSGYKDESEVILAYQESERIQLMISQTEEKIDKSRLRLEKENQNRETYQKGLDKLRSDLQVLNVEADTLNRQLKKLQVNQYTGKDPQMIKGIALSLLKKYDQLILQYETMKETLSQMQRQHDTIGSRLVVRQDLLRKEQNILEDIHRKLNEQLLKSDQTLEQVQLVLDWKPDLEAEKQKVDRFRSELEVTVKQLQLLNIEKGGNTYDAGKHRMIAEKIVQTGNELETAQRNLGKLEEALKMLKQNLEQRDKLQASLGLIEARLNNLKVLKQLFKGGGFVNYISSVYLKELCAQANDRFYKLSGQKLSLEVTPDNNFEVRDFMNGGKVRSIKTLSGGQTFQAALSLALALSDNNRKIHGAGENFFFLDEGFGSLDKASLGVVYETLKSLRKENRTVGVISHVEEMQQEIDIHLRVVNSDDSGSRIEKSWE